MCRGRQIGDDVEKAGADDSKNTPVSRRNRIAWALLLKRVWEIDVTICDKCGGRMSITAFLSDQESIRRYLDGVGLPADVHVTSSVCTGYQGVFSP